MHFITIVLPCQFLTVRTARSMASSLANGHGMTEDVVLIHKLGGDHNHRIIIAYVLYLYHTHCTTSSFKNFFACVSPS
jgi:hypothetical protein